MTTKNKTAVITGATGMLALALMRKLTAEGYRIYAVIRPDSPRAVNIPQTENITVMECALSDMERLPAMIHESCGEFYHFGWDGTYGGARDDMQLQTRNIKAAAEAAEAAAKLGCSVFLGAGSQAEYGRQECMLSSDTPASPENGYGAAKLCAGHMTRIICRRNGVRHIWCRILSAYGPYDGEKTMIMSGIIKMLNGEKAIFTKGEQQWDYIYCDDAAEAFYLAAQKGRDGSVYCVGSGKTRLIRDYIYAMRDIIDPALPVGIGEIPYSDKQVMYLCADTDPLARDTGFSPRTGFEDGIRKTVEWYKSGSEKK